MAHSALATLLCSCGSTGCAGCGTSCVLISWQLHRHVGSEAATAAAQMDTNGRTSMDILHHAPEISVLIQSHSFLSSVHVAQSSSHVFACVCTLWLTCLRVAARQCITWWKSEPTFFPMLQRGNAGCAGCGGVSRAWRRATRVKASCALFSADGINLSNVALDNRLHIGGKRLHFFIECSVQVCCSFRQRGAFNKKNILLAE